MALGMPQIDIKPTLSVNYVFKEYRAFYLQRERVRAISFSVLIVTAPYQHSNELIRRSRPRSENVVDRSDCPNVVPPD